MVAFTGSWGDCWIRYPIWSLTSAHEIISEMICELRQPHQSYTMSDCMYFCILCLYRAYRNETYPAVWCSGNIDLQYSLQQNSDTKQGVLFCPRFFSYVTGLSISSFPPRTHFTRNIQKENFHVVMKEAIFLEFYDSIWFKSWESSPWSY